MFKQEPYKLEIPPTKEDLDLGEIELEGKYFCKSTHAHKAGEVVGYIAKFDLRLYRIFNFRFGKPRYKVMAKSGRDLKWNWYLVDKEGSKRCMSTKRFDTVRDAMRSICCVLDIYIRLDNVTEVVEKNWTRIPPEPTTEFPFIHVKLTETASKLTETASAPSVKGITIGQLV